jgi:hypothetical protein
MNKWIAHSLIGLYPRAWRARYGEEFEAFLESHPNNVRALCDVVGWAIYERLCYLGGFNMNPDQRSLALMAYAWLGVVAAGVNFYWTVADTPMATAMRSQPALFATWTMVRGGALLALAAVVIVGLPTLVSVARVALSARLWSVVGRLAVPPIAAAVTLFWMATAAMWTKGHWLPTPWDVTGDWAAPSEWPPLMTRWALSIVTFLLLILGLIVSAVSVKQVIHRSSVSARRRLLTAPSLILAGSTSLMAAAVAAWGLFAERYASDAFHARNGGFFSSTNFASWAASCRVFVVSAVIALRVARLAMNLPSEG